MFLGLFIPHDGLQTLPVNFVDGNRWKAAFRGQTGLMRVDETLRGLVRLCKAVYGLKRPYKALE